MPNIFLLLSKLEIVLGKREDDILKNADQKENN